MLNMGQGPGPLGGGHAMMGGQGGGAMGGHMMPQVDHHSHPYHFTSLLSPVSHFSSCRGHR